jgi:hypothetical protein
MTGDELFELTAPTISAIPLLIICNSRALIYRDAG